MGASGISSGFPLLSRSSGQVAHVLLTRSPLGLLQCFHCMDLVRLACVKHAASVRPEPGSNSPSRPRSPTPKRPTPSIRRAGVGTPKSLNRLAPRRTVLSVLVLTSCEIGAPKRSDRARTSFWLPLFRFQGASQRRHAPQRDVGVGPPWPDSARCITLSHPTHP